MFMDFLFILSFISLLGSIGVFIWTVKTKGDRMKKNVISPAQNILELLILVNKQASYLSNDIEHMMTEDYNALKELSQSEEFVELVDKITLQINRVSEIKDLIDVEAYEGPEDEEYIP